MEGMFAATRHKVTLPGKEQFVKTKKFHERAQPFMDFFQGENKHVLMVMGPSGCGKHMLFHQCLADYNEVARQRSALLRALEEEESQHTSTVNSQTANGVQTRLRLLPTNALVADSHDGGRLRQLSLPEQIKKACTELSNTDVVVFDDLPDPKCKRFYSEWHSLLKYCRGKLVFLLNSTIYKQMIALCSTYTIERNFQTERDQLGINYYHIKAYQKTDLGEIAAYWLEVNRASLGTKQHQKMVLREHIENANGDARRLLNSLWFHTQIQSKQSKKRVADSSMEIEEEDPRPTNMFHFLGKLLNNKRWDEKEKKQRRFTTEELETLDPPFYFNPVRLFEASRLKFSTVESLLHENYLVFYSNIRDITNMAGVFCRLDGLKMETWLARLDFEAITTTLLCWATMIYNLHSVTDFHSFRRSPMWKLKYDIAEKLKLLRYITFPTRTTNMLQCALFSRQICRLLGLEDMFVIRNRRHTNRLLHEDELADDQEDGSDRPVIPLQLRVNPLRTFDLTEKAPVIINTEDIEDSEQEERKKQIERDKLMELLRHMQADESQQEKRLSQPKPSPNTEQEERRRFAIQLEMEELEQLLNQSGHR